MLCNQLTFMFISYQSQFYFSRVLKLIQNSRLKYLTLNINLLLPQRQLLLGLHLTPMHHVVEPVLDV
jgi:hypothetical protein